MSRYPPFLIHLNNKARQRKGVRWIKVSGELDPPGWIDASGGSNPRGVGALDPPALKSGRGG